MACTLKELELHHVLDNFPAKNCKVSFGGVDVNHGNVLTPTQAKDFPTCLEWDADSKKLYSVLVVDPDAPSRKDPQWREWLHYLCVNVPGCNVSKGEECVGYVGPGPPENSGLHRYIYLIFEQNEKVTFKGKKLSATDATDRGGQSARKIVETNKLGSLVAWNCFQAQFDDYVPVLYKKLGF